MKVIGGITPDFQDNDGRVSNGDYLGGSIVMLSKAEMMVLEMLQSSLKGDQDDWLNRSQFRSSVDTNVVMDDAFSLVLIYARSKFAVNEFKSSVEWMEGLLKGNYEEGLESIKNESGGK